MSNGNRNKTWCAAVLLLIFGGGCGGSQKKSDTNPAVPTVIFSIPSSGASGACPNTLITATFSKAMKASSIGGTTFTITGPGSTAVLGQVTYDASSKTAIFAPSSALTLSTLYTATVTTGAQDASGNALASNLVWSFTTAGALCQPGPPSVISVSPTDGASGVCPNTIVVATFGADMNPATINATSFSVTAPGPVSVAGEVTYDAPGRSAIFTPSNPLALSTLYAATVTTGAEDVLGNATASASTWTFTTAAAACRAPQVSLGSAADVDILAGSTVTSTGPTIITGGDLALSPGSAVTGFPPGTLTTPAVMHVTDPTAAQAQVDLTTAYLYTAGLPGGAVLPGDLSGLTFTPGLYKTSSTVKLSAGNVTLDAQGDVNAIFIFQVASTLTTIGSTQVVLAGGAQAKNVFWQTGSSATLGTNSIFKGTIMALQSITLKTGATLQGRALARNGAVTLDSNAVDAP
ncbi:MAG: ice-binding family protein [Terriglobales bacterium]